MTRLKTLLSIALLALLAGCGLYFGSFIMLQSAKKQHDKLMEELTANPLPELSLTNSVLYATNIYTVSLTNTMWGGYSASWLNDGVYYLTNDYVYDEERNKTNKSPVFFYMKTVVTTNKVTPNYYRMNDQLVEFGCREDGTVVWRKVNNETNR